MKISFDELELKAIIQDHLVNQMPDLSNRNFEIVLIAGRGETGHRAEIEVLTTSAPVQQAVAETVTDDEPAVDFSFGDTE